VKLADEFFQSLRPNAVGEGRARALLCC